MGRRERLAMSGYPEGPVAYFEYIDDWRNSGDFAGLEVRLRGALTFSVGRVVRGSWGGGGRRVGPWVVCRCR